MPDSLNDLTALLGLIVAVATILGGMRWMVESLRNEMKAENKALSASFDVQFSNVYSRLDGIDNRLEGIDKRLDGVDKRLDGVDKRLDGVDKRLDGIDKRLGGVDHRIDGVDKRIDGLDSRLGNVEANVGHIFWFLISGRDVSTIPLDLIADKPPMPGADPAQSSKEAT